MLNVREAKSSASTYYGDMKRTMITHEITLVVMYQLYMVQFVKESPDLFIRSHGTIFQIIKEIHDAFDMQNYETVRNAYGTFESLLLEDNVVKKFAEFENDRETNVQLQWVLIYMRMLQSLMLFRYASRERNWRLHLKGYEDTSIDRIKYRRLHPVYVAEMIALEQREFTYNLAAFVEREFFDPKS